MKNFSRYDLTEWGIPRETSEEIVRAIFNYRKTEKARDRVWQNPTEREMKLIEKMAWSFADEDETELYWGCTTLYKSNTKKEKMYMDDGLLISNYDDDFSMLQEFGEMKRYKNTVYFCQCPTWMNLSQLADFNSRAARETPKENFVNRRATYEQCKNAQFIWFYNEKGETVIADNLNDAKKQGLKFKKF